MDKNQKRMIAIVLCIIGIVGTLMAGKDASAQRTRESTAIGIESTVTFSGRKIKNRPRMA